MIEGVKDHPIKLSQGQIAQGNNSDETHPGPFSK